MLRLVILDARIDVCRCLDVVDEGELVNKCLPCVFADFVGKDGVGGSSNHPAVASATTRAASCRIRSPNNDFAERRLSSSSGRACGHHATGSSILAESDVRFPVVRDPLVGFRQRVDYCAHTSTSCQS